MDPPSRWNKRHFFILALSNLLLTIPVEALPSAAVGASASPSSLAHEGLVDSHRAVTRSIYRSSGKNGYVPLNSLTYALMNTRAKGDVNSWANRIAGQIQKSKLAGYSSLEGTKKNTMPEGAKLDQALALVEDSANDRLLSPTLASLLVTRIKNSVANDDDQNMRIKAEKEANGANENNIINMSVPSQDFGDNYASEESKTGETLTSEFINKYLSGLTNRNADSNLGILHLFPKFTDDVLSDAQETRQVMPKKASNNQIIKSESINESQRDKLRGEPKISEDEFIWIFTTTKKPATTINPKTTPEAVRTTPGKLDFQTLKETILQRNSTTGEILSGPTVQDSFLSWPTNANTMSETTPEVTHKIYISSTQSSTASSLTTPETEAEVSRKPAASLIPPTRVQIPYNASELPTISNGDFHQEDPIVAFTEEPQMAGINALNEVFEHPDKMNDFSYFPTLHTTELPTKWPLDSESVTSHSPFHFSLIDLTLPSHMHHPGHATESSRIPNFGAGSSPGGELSSLEEAKATIPTTYTPDFSPATSMRPTTSSTHTGFDYYVKPVQNTIINQLAHRPDLSFSFSYPQVFQGHPSATSGPTSTSPTKETDHHEEEPTGPSQAVYISSNISQVFAFSDVGTSSQLSSNFPYLKPISEGHLWYETQEIPTSTQNLENLDMVDQQYNGNLKGITEPHGAHSENTLKRPFHGLYKPDINLFWNNTFPTHNYHPTILINIWNYKEGNLTLESTEEVSADLLTEHENDNSVYNQILPSKIKSKIIALMYGKRNSSAITTKGEKPLHSNSQNSYSSSYIFPYNVDSSKNWFYSEATEFTPTITTRMLSGKISTVVPQNFNLQQIPISGYNHLSHSQIPSSVYQSTEAATNTFNPTDNLYNFVTSEKQDNSYIPDHYLSEVDLLAVNKDEFKNPQTQHDLWHKLQNVNTFKPATSTARSHTTPYSSAWQKSSSGNSNLSPSPIYPIKPPTTTASPILDTLLHNTSDVGNLMELLNFESSIPVSQQHSVNNKTTIKTASDSQASDFENVVDNEPDITNYVSLLLSEDFLTSDKNNIDEALPTSSILTLSPTTLSIWDETEFIKLLGTMDFTDAEILYILERLALEYIISSAPGYIFKKDEAEILLLDILSERYRLTHSSSFPNSNVKIPQILEDALQEMFSLPESNPASLNEFPFDSLDSEMQSQLRPDQNISSPFNIPSGASLPTKETPYSSNYFDPISRSSLRAEAIKTGDDSPLYQTSSALNNLAYDSTSTKPLKPTKENSIRITGEEIMRNVTNFFTSMLPITLSKDTLSKCFGDHLCMLLSSLAASLATTGALALPLFFRKRRSQSFSELQDTKEEEILRILHSAKELYGRLKENR